MNKGIAAIFSVIISLLLLSGSCSSIPGPTNLEPQISISPASEITRNDATLKAYISLRGNGKLSFFRFRYGETEAMIHESPDIPLNSDTIIFRLSGLKAGTEYYFSAEGGNGSAVVSSQTMTFTTDPNVVPTVSEAKAISSGPVGMIVGFTLSSDGGTPISKAGFDLKNLASGETWRLFLDSDPIGIGQYRMYIRIDQSASKGEQYLITPFAINKIGEAFGKPITFTQGEAVNLITPGTLSIVLNQYDPPVDSLVIAGKMNGDDFRFLRKMLKAPLLPGEAPLESSISCVDISNADIVAGGATYDGSRFTSRDTISTGLFANCRSLKRIILPISAIAIESDAFSGCDELHELTIPPNIKTIQVSSGCTALEKIDVSEANSRFMSIDGVLFNSRLSEIIWVPQAINGHFSVPSSVERINENAFFGSLITSIAFPSGIKYIGRSAFAASSIEEIVLPDDLENLPGSLFQDCRKLTSIHIGKDTRYVGNYAFDGCRLQNLYLSSENPPFLEKEAFGANAQEIFGSCILHVPESSVSIYRNHQEWGRFANIIAYSTKNR